MSSSGVWVPHDWGIAVELCYVWEQLAESDLRAWIHKFHSLGLVLVLDLKAPVHWKAQHHIGLDSRVTVILLGLAGIICVSMAGCWWSPESGEMLLMWRAHRSSDPSFKMTLKHNSSSLREYSRRYTPWDSSRSLNPPQS